jgi:cytochrome c-type biogenesis protein
VIEFGPAAFLAAFAAGFLSFSSPCVLPLVPAYLSFVTGLTFDELETNTRRVVTSTAGFVVGFGAVFVALGAGIGWFGDALASNRRLLEIAAGVFIVFAGLVFAGAQLPLTLLREKRLSLPRGKGPVAPVLAGVAFSIGWTPCVGPTLAAILALSAGGANPTQGAALLAVYALGLGVPFLVFGLVFTRALAVTRAVRRHYRTIALASGATLVAFGALLATGELREITSRLARFTGVEL